MNKKEVGEFSMTEMGKFSMTLDNLDSIRSKIFLKSS